MHQCSACQADRQIALPKQFPSPKYQFGQVVGSRTCWGRIVGMTFFEPGNLAQSSPGWHYEIQLPVGFPSYFLQEGREFLSEAEILRVLTPAIDPIP